MLWHNHLNLKSNKQLPFQEKKIIKEINVKHLMLTNLELFFMCVKEREMAGNTLLRIEILLLTFYCVYYNLENMSKLVL